MFFRDVIGQEEIKQRLIQEVNEGVFHMPSLFAARKGSGKCRWLCIRTLHQLHQSGETDACGTCPSCVKFNKLVHPDVHFVFPIVKSAKGKRKYAMII